MRKFNVRGFVSLVLGFSFVVVLVSGLFGFLHFPQGTAVPMIVLSVVACLLVLASGSMLWAVALHVGWNALAVVHAAPSNVDRWIVAGIGVALLIGLLVRGGLVRGEAGSR